MYGLTCPIVIVLWQRFVDGVKVLSDVAKESSDWWLSHTTDQVRSPIFCFAIPVDGLHSTLKEIEKRSQVLLENGEIARFIDKGRDSGRW